MIKYHIQLRNNLQKISFKRKLNFAIQICERIYPEYLKFYELNDFGNPELLEKGIDVCRKYEKSKFSEKEINDLILKIKSVTPDTEDYGELIGFLALNAAASVSEMLKFVLNSNDKHIFDIANFMFDSVDFQVSDRYPNLNDKEIKWQLQQTDN
ncbi:MAG: DUF416 family protein [Maribacter sp.]|uniref:DUF416 family protein n=1 Tax=Maribacter sp. TaxID=1897614 RepID=UPI003296EFD5